MKKNKTIITLFVILMIICIAMVVVSLVVNKELYRIVKVYEFEGDGVITRESVGDIEPYNNMVLESGDNVKHNKGIMMFPLSFKIQRKQQT